MLLVGVGNAMPGANQGFPIPVLPFGFNALNIIIPLLLGLLVIYGGMKMKNLENYTLAIVSAIVAMIPCTSPCCFLGLPIGIWALVVLCNTDVKMAFRG
jgi:hypothetical protein